MSLFQRGFPPMCGRLALRVTNLLGLFIANRRALHSRILHRFPLSSNFKIDRTRRDWACEFTPENFILDCSALGGYSNIHVVCWSVY